MVRRGRRRSEPATAHRFVEPPIGPLRLTTATLALGALWVLVASAAGFLLMLGLWITLEEAVTDVWFDLDLDPVSRTWLAVLIGIAALAVIVWALALSADRFLLGRRLARAARSDPLAVPPAAVRRAGSRDPFLPLLVLSRTLIGIGATIAVVDVLLWAETDDAVASTIVLAACVFPIGGLLVLNGAMAAARTTRWPAVVAVPRNVWTRQVIGSTVAAERSRGPALGRPSTSSASRARRRAGRSLVLAGTTAAVGGAGVHFLGVFIRQPGRYADPVSYEEQGETTIDVLSVVGAVVVALGLLLLLAAALRDVVSHASARRRLLRAPIVDGRGPSREDVERELVATSPATSVGAALIGTSVVAISPLVAAIIVARDRLHPLNDAVPDIRFAVAALAAAVLLGLALIAVGLVHARSYRQALRDRLHPGDDPAPLPRSSSGNTGSDPVWAPVGDGDGTRHDGHGGGGRGDGGGSGDDGRGGDGGGDGGGGGGGGSD